ncbi:hypothetical protein HYU92_01045 [Candidatus Curtissbacteria bacterium]|nr:hypothetical protein [Candidatus Curtissbacteria bacterium]
MPPITHREFVLKSKKWNDKTMRRAWFSYQIPPNTKTGPLRRFTASRGYLTPPVLIGLAIICLVVAGTLFFNSFLIRNARDETIDPSPSVQPTSSRQTDKTDHQSKIEDFECEPRNTPGTANWITYKDSQDKFCFKHPQSLTTGGAFLQFMPNDNSKVGGVIGFSVTENYDEYYKILNLEPGEKIEEFHAAKAPLYKIRNLTIDGNPAIEYVVDGTDPEGGHDIFYYHKVDVTFNGKILGFVSRGGSKEEQEKWDQIFMQMVNTIKFQN